VQDLQSKQNRKSNLAYELHNMLRK